MIVLASASPVRSQLLERCGLDLVVDPARVDEAAIKASMLAEEAPARDIADTLADVKAARVSSRHPGAFVIGADQVLVASGVLYDKPSDQEAARGQLEALSGRSHELLSAAVIYRDGRAEWRHIGQARLVMRALSSAFLDEYVARHGNDLLDTVGGYKLEEDGPLLFTRIEGDYFSILGMPLLQILAYLRTRGLLRA
ncbi:MAG: Maf family protein [Pseudomonadota bacterium]